MKSLTRRGMCLLVALCFMVTAFSVRGASASAEGVEVFPENSVWDISDDAMLGAGDDGEDVRTGMLRMDCVEGDSSQGAADGNSAIDVDNVPLGADAPQEGSAESDYIDWSSLENDDGDVPLGAGGASISSSTSSIQLYPRNTTSIVLTLNYCYEEAYIDASWNDGNIISCRFTDWYDGNKIQLRVTGGNPGTDRITVSVISRAGRTLSSVQIGVTVRPNDPPRLVLSTSSVSVAVGDSARVNVTVDNFSGSGTISWGSTNDSAYSCEWGSPNQLTFPLTIRGKDAGSGTVTIELHSDSGAVLATARFSVSVYRRDNPKLEISPSSIILKAGNSTTVYVTPSGFSGECYLNASYQDTRIINCRWGSSSNNRFPLIVTGLNPGDDKITISLVRKDGTILVSRIIYPVTITRAKYPSLKVNKSSVSITSAQRDTVYFSVYDLDEDAYLEYSTTNEDAYSCAWGSNGNNSYGLDITGKARGTGTVTVYLKRSSDKAVLDYQRVSVSVTQAGKRIEEVGFGFQNYSKPDISYDLCNYLFGNSLKALTVYWSDVGNGGCCFGFASGSMLINVPNNVSVSSFNNLHRDISMISELRTSDRSNMYSLSIADFIEVMQTAQKSSKMNRLSGLDNLIFTVKSETDAGRPVLISIRGLYNGNDSGHAVVAFGYNQVSSTRCDLRIYDSNYGYSSTNIVEKTLTITKSSASGSYDSWTYQVFGNTTWGSGRQYAQITYTPYSIIQSIWNSRGSWDNLNLFSTTENDFSLYSFDGDLVVRYENGSMVQKSDDVIEVWEYNLTPDGAVDQPNMFYAPVDTYTVIDGSPDTPIALMLCDNDLYVNVDTEADSFDLVADDSENLANAIFTPEEGEHFSVAIGAMVSGEIQETRLDGYGDGLAVSIGLQGGELSVIGAQNAELYVSNMEDEFTISASVSQGGVITPAGDARVALRDSAVYHIAPNSGYSIKDVYVDGRSVGAVDTYCFNDVQASHTIFAEFSRDLDGCAITLSGTQFTYDGSAHTPSVTVKTPEGIVLRENIDYVVSYENNIGPGTAYAYAVAVNGSDYNGAIVAAFDIAEGRDGITNATYSASSGKVHLEVSHSETATVIVGVYGADGRMSAVRVVRLEPTASTADISLSGVQINSSTTLKVFLVDLSLTPLCDAWIVAH